MTPVGVSGWMLRVLEECGRAQEALDPEPVHDLRVALRRCRSMADSLARVDPDRDWRRLKRIARPLFRSLGELRDAQVLIETTERLAEPFDPLRRALLGRLTLRENAQRVKTRRALDAFDRKEWKRLARSLPRRAAHLPEDGLVFESIAVERWTEVVWLQEQAQRSRSRIGWHRLRIGIKRFRYVVENFLPRRDAGWGAELKRFQDLLGEVHDLDLLSAELPRARPVPTPAERDAWRERIATERGARLAEYRSLATGRRSFWLRVRAELVEGDRLRASAVVRLATWAAFLDPDIERTGRVARIALELHDALAALAPATFGAQDARAILEGAALTHAIDRAPGKKTRPKRAARLLRGLASLPGLDARPLETLALVVRYHRGAEPRYDDRAFATLDAPGQGRVRALAGILRLAVVLGSAPGRAVSHIEVVPLAEVVQILAIGFGDDEESAVGVARAKHLLETVLGRPCLVRPVAPRLRLVAPDAQGGERGPTS